MLNVKQMFCSVLICSSTRSFGRMTHVRRQIVCLSFKDGYLQNMWICMSL